MEKAAHHHEKAKTPYGADSANEKKRKEINW